MQIKDQSGVLFSKTYGCDLPQKAEKFRVQLEAFFDSLKFDDEKKTKLQEYLASMAGIRIQGKHTYNKADGVFYDFSEYMHNAAEVELFDFITHVANFLQKSRAIQNRDDWIQLVNMVFNTHNMNYCVLSCGSVQHKIDDAYQKSKFSTLECLSDEKFQSAQESVSKADHFLTKIQPDLIEAICNIFIGAENVFKILVDKNGFNKKKLLNWLDALSIDTANRDARRKVANSLFEWEHSCHQYRHGQSSKETITVPLEQATVIVSLGIAYIRWLVGLRQSQEN